MKKLLSMVLCAMMALTLAGCGGSGGDSSTYTFSSELDIKNLDSSDADDGCSFTAMHAVIDGLMKTDKKGNIVNGVASSSEVSDDGLTHTYKIRKDAKWANGDPVTANDFVYAWHRIFQKKGQYYYMFCDGIASIVGAQEMSDKIDNEEDITDAESCLADYILLDSGEGTGTVFDWKKIQNIQRPYFLAGGLSIDNVENAVRQLNPYAVDVSSGIETDGLKDKTKMAAFVAAVRKEERL